MARVLAVPDASEAENTAVFVVRPCSGRRGAKLVVALPRSAKSDGVTGQTARLAKRCVLGRGAKRAETASGARVERVAGKTARYAKTATRALVRRLRAVPPPPASSARPTARTHRS